MLKGLPFYGTGGATMPGTLATIIDLTINATAVTKLPQAGFARKVAIRGCTLIADATTKNIWAELQIGQGGDSHKILIPPTADADTIAADRGMNPWYPLGDFIAQENEDLAIYLYDAGASAKMSGVLWYDDLEPEVEIPKGRIVTMKFPKTVADVVAASNYNTGQGAGEPLYKFNPKCHYYVVGVEVRPEDKVVQALGLHASGRGVVAVAPGKGRLFYPSVPLEFDGIEVVVEGCKVEGDTEVCVFWFFVEIPLAGAEVENGEVADLKPSIGGTSILQTDRAPKAKNGLTLKNVIGAIRRG